MIRDDVRRLFKEYTASYNVEDPKIRLKVEHTYRVAELTDDVTNSIQNEYGMDEDDRTLAWIIGMLHDIGRFEQVKRYGTFWDSESVDHAEFGADLLFGPNRDERLNIKLPETDIIECAIRNHNKYKLPSNLSDRERLFSEIIRDTDKIDIMRVQREFTPEEIYGVTFEELLDSDITDEVLNAALEGHAVDRKIRKTPMDTIVSHASMMQELSFDRSRQIVREQGYMKSLLDKPVRKTETIEKLEILKKHLSYLI